MSVEEPISDDDDDELDEALEGFVRWARGESADDFAGLPPLEALEQRGAGARFGDFELARPLRGGGSGIVYEARQLSVARRRVALKLLRSLFGSRRGGLRFEREIATIARLEHRAIVPIYAAGVHQGMPFFAMRYLDGLAADRLVACLRELDRSPEAAADVARALHGAVAAKAWGGKDAEVWSGPYSRWVARTGLQLAEALQHAHEHGVIHRDVKPANVMIQLDGRPVLIDFGLALGADDPRLTGSRDLLGTLAYASPEQLGRQELDTRTDVYSLGLTLYELLGLRRAFDGWSPSELARQIEREDPPPLRAPVPRDLRTILERALEKKRERRYATPGAMAADLRAFLEGRPIEARPRAPLARLVAAVRRRPTTAAVLAAIALLLLGLRGWDHVRAGSAVAEARAALVELEALGREHAELLEDYAARFDSAGPQRVLPDPKRVAEIREELDAWRVRWLATAGRVQAPASSAFDFVAGHRGAHRALADLAAAELVRALRECRDLTQPEEFERLEEELRDADPRGRHAALLARRGELSIDCATAGATARVSRDGLEVLAGAAPLTLADVEEGVYDVALEAPGCLAAECPVLVRRSAADLDERARARRSVRIALLEVGEDVPGFVYVPDGWTLVEDSPPRWALLEGFQIQEREVTYGEWMAWLSGPLIHEDAVEARRSSATRFRPRDSDADTHVILVPMWGGLFAWWFTDGWDLSVDLPVRGLACFEMGAYYSCLPRVPGWSYDLPLVEEFVRAARGADGRRYPWGHEFEASRCSYYDRAGDSDEPTPVAVGSHHGDRSPFGILDLAGSVSEATSKRWGVVADDYAVCGGSYRDADPFELTTTAVRPSRNVPLLTVGFRMVLRQVPRWMRAAEPDRIGLRADFDGPDGALPEGWLEFVGNLNQPRDEQDERAGCRVAGGRLLVASGEGDSSSHASALHRVRTAEGGYVLCARLRASWTHEPSDRAEPWGIKVVLCTGPDTARDPFAQVWITTNGAAGLAFQGVSRKTDGARVDLREEHRIELRADAAGSELRIWPADTARPEQPRLATPLTVLEPRWLALEAGNYIGCTLEVDEVELRPLD